MRLMLICPGNIAIKYYKPFGFLKIHLDSCGSELFALISKADNKLRQRTK